MYIFGNENIIIIIFKIIIAQELEEHLYQRYNMTPVCFDTVAFYKCLKNKVK